MLSTTPFVELTTAETANIATDIVNDMPKSDAYSTDYMIGKTARILSDYDIYFIAAFGIPGNILAFITVLQFKQHTSTVLHVSVLALADSAALLLSILRRVILFFHLVNNWNCGLLLYLVNINMTFASWAVVVMTVERFIAVWFPFKVKLFFTKCRHMLIVSIIYTSISIIYMPALWSFTTKHDKFLNKPKCKTDPSYYATIKVISSIGAALYSVAPCCLLTVLNCLIIAKTRAAQKLLHQINGAQDYTDSRSRQQNQITKMLITVSVIFVLLILPNAIWYQVVKPGGDLSNGLRLVKSLILVLSYTNNAINFYVYILVSNTFRNQFTETVCCKKNQPTRGVELDGTDRQYSVSTNISSISRQVQITV